MTEEPQAIQQPYQPKPHHKAGYEPHINKDDLSGCVTAFFYNLQHLEEFAKQAGLQLQMGTKGPAYQTVTLPNGHDMFLGSHQIGGEYWTLQLMTPDTTAADDTVSCMQGILTAAKPAEA